MRILLTGGAGDLGRLLSAQLAGRGHEPVCFDLREPPIARGALIRASILDRQALARGMEGVDLVVHIAAWHGVHLFRKEKDVYDFWDLNVTGSFNVFQAAAEAGVSKVLHISSESVADRDGVYGHTKVLAEEIARTYSHRHGMDVIVLRPRAFIPWWNRETYSSWLEWAKWFWKGAVHIDDVARACLQSVELLAAGKIGEPPVLNVDGAYDYSEAELASWDAGGPGSSFRAHYAAYYELALRHGLDPALKPETLDISQTRAILGYEPRYSLLDLLKELEAYGPGGPPAPLV
jgi:nucleoside-diphosphate-sugar epimerase